MAKGKWSVRGDGVADEPTQPLPCRPCEQVSFSAEHRNPLLGLSGNRRFLFQKGHWKQRTVHVYKQSSGAVHAHTAGSVNFTSTVKVQGGNRTHIILTERF